MVSDRFVTVWLLDSDPAIRWQALQDLAGASPEEVWEERAKVAETGWGAALLSQQNGQGEWQGDDMSLLRTTHCLVLLKEKAFGSNGETRQARVRAEEYILERKLIRRLSTGEIIDKRWTRFHFPTTWHYDVLRGLEYFRSSGRQFEARMGEAMEIVKLRRHQNGRWPLVKPYKDDLLKFEMETQVGAASRWNTLRGMRVLKWFEPGE